MLELLTLPPSPHNLKVRLALLLKGLEFRTTAVTGFEERDAILERTGQPLTPVLIDGDKSVFDSFGIVRYLDANWREPQLFRPEREAMREIERWERFALQEVGPHLAAILGLMWSGDDDAVVQRANDGMRAAGEKIEEVLATRDYLVDERISAADITVAPFLRGAALTSEGLEEGSVEHFVVSRARLDPKLERTHAWIERVFAIDKNA